MAGATATKNKKNDTLQLVQFNVHNSIKQTYVTVYCQAKILLNVLKYLDISVRHRPQ